MHIVVKYTGVTSRGRTRRASFVNRREIARGAFFSIETTPPKIKSIEPNMTSSSSSSSSVLSTCSISPLTPKKSKLLKIESFDFGRTNQKRKNNPSWLLLDRNRSKNPLLLNHQRTRRPPSRLVQFCCYNETNSRRGSGGTYKEEVKETVSGFSSAAVEDEMDSSSSRLNVEIGNPNQLTYLPAAKLSLSDQAFFLLAFIACTTSIAFTSLVVAAIPTLFAMGRAATSLSKLADTTREELPSTMAAIRLSGMEISDLTLELSDLSQEIADGVSKSTQAVQVAEAGIRKIGTIARQQTMSMIQERASLPKISIQPVVAGAAKKTSNAVGRATKNFMYFFSRGEVSTKNEDNGTDRLEL